MDLNIGKLRNVSAASDGSGGRSLAQKLVRFLS